MDELIRKLGDSVQVNSVNKWSQSTMLGLNSSMNASSSGATTTTATTTSTSESKTSSSSSSSTPAVTVSISTLTGLLSTLCRSSDSINKQILESNILDSIEKALYGDERCVLDTMRFLDLLVTLIFEGRQALRKQVFTPPVTMIARNNNNSNNETMKSGLIGSGQGAKLKKYDPTMDKIHRQLIEYIRLKDTHSFISTLETHQIDLNFMDDVGQTLLNWTSAFGTLEMVEYLASRGADVNKGVRSSSLHYAACFGRANVVRILLSYGANPELRDEEGKTALDKARERGEESHREVVQILQHAPAVVGSAVVGTDMVTAAGTTGSGSGEDADGLDFDADGLDEDDEDENDVDNDENDDNDDNEVSNNEQDDAANLEAASTGNEEEKSNHETTTTAAAVHENETKSNSNRSDETTTTTSMFLYDIKLTYLKRLVPTFCKIYLNCMIQSINKSCLNLLRKLISYASREQLDRIVQMNIDSTLESISGDTSGDSGTSISTLLIELISKILQEDANYESIYTGLSISSDLFKKCSPFILEEFMRLGAANLISQLAAQESSSSNVRKNYLLL